MKSFTLKIALGVAIAGLALVTGLSAGDAQAASGDRPFTAVSQLATPVVSSQFASLEEAVVAGKLDHAVVDALRLDGSVDALVTFERSSPSTRNIALGAQKASSTKALADRLRRALTGHENRVFRSADPGANVLDQLSNLPLSFVRFTSADALLDVLNGSGVTGVRENRHGTATTQESLQLIRQPTAVAAGHRGAGAYVAVLDTGVDYLHPDFGCTALGVPSTCRVTHAQEFADADGYRDDGSFHGSNVAGIVGKVAPGAKILAFDVFQWFTRYDQYGSPYQSHEWTSAAVAGAINRAITLKSNGLNIVALNLSLGVGNTYETGACSKGWELESPFALAHDWGILPVVASGNDAIEPGYFRSGISYPACLADAFSVGAVHDSAHPAVYSGGYCEAGSAADALTSFTQSSSNLDILAPGSCIVAGGRTMNGTSQAAPHVAGAAAILAAARYGAARFYEQDLTGIETALRTTGKPIYDSRSGVTRNRLDIPAALQALGTGSTDTTSPTVGSVTQVIPSLITTAGSTIDSYGRVPVRASWTASDAGSGLAELDVEIATNGVWQQLSTPSASQTTVSIVAPTGTNTYQFRVAAKDAAGNWSAWVYGTSFKLTLHQETSTSIAYAGSWSLAGWASALGGQLRLSNQVGATARLSFTGRNVAVVGTVASNRGQATFSLDGSAWGTRSLTSTSTLAQAVVFSYSWPTSGTHTIEVKVASGTIDVDAFVVMS